MIVKVSKTFCSMFRAGSFFFALIFLSSNLFAAEVARSLSLEDKVRILEQQLSSANRMRAESQFEMTNLKNEIRELRGLVEEQGYQLQQIVTRQRELYRDIDRQNAQLKSSDQAAVKQNTTPVDSSTSSNSEYNTSDVSTVDASADASVNENEERSSYDKIFPLVRKKQYNDAIDGYQQFITKYPSSVYVANSRYWLAQIYFVQGRYDEAEQEYLTVAQSHSASTKAPDAWLKLGQLYERQGQVDQAMNAFNQVVTLYTNSTAAQMAITRLQALKGNN